MGEAAPARALTPHEARRPVWTRPVVLYALVTGIVIADGLTPAGVVVGILLAVPILLSSAGDDRRTVVYIGGASVLGFVLAAIFGEGPISPEAVWLPNRVFATIAIVASSVVALLLQQRRLEAESARAEAESARAEAESSRDLSRLLHSLMAHDLRAPLALAQQAIQAVEEPVKAGVAVDLELLGEVDARLRRSLRSIQLVLDAARSDLSPPEESPAPAPLVDFGRELREEVASFDAEAAAKGKVLHIELPADGQTARIEPSVLRQSVAILLDNAIRYAVPGPVRVSASIDARMLRVSVRDSGPGLARSRAGAPKGEGLGLRLCELLAQRAGGRLEVARDGETGTEFVLRLPVGQEGEAPKPRRIPRERRV